MVGRKVRIRGEESAGFGEVETLTADGAIATVRFYTSPSIYSTISVPVNLLRFDTTIPAQTRCVVDQQDEVRIGRILGPTQVGSDGIRSYWIQSPNQVPASINEDRFRVISYRGEADPIAVLGHLGHETPFFAAKRLPLLTAINAQRNLMKGMTGLAAARIELFEHQVETSRRILLDPKMRYLLADEVGLGKTIEAGIIISQLTHDDERLRATVYTPRSLCAQWRDELDRRFRLTDVSVLDHEQLAKSEKSELDLLVVDEVHQLVARQAHGASATADLALHLRSLALRTPRVLLLTATPILSRDQELLSLLSILDPENFAEKDLPAFQRLLGLRQEIGRSLIALENVTMASMIRSQVMRVSNLLGEDTTVRSFAQAIDEKLATQDRDGARVLLGELRLHLGETYRVHRRMLRTRRKSLMETSGIGAQRSEQPVEFDLEDGYQRIWELFEDYRIVTAAETADIDVATAANDYLRLGETMTASPHEAAGICEDILRRGVPRTARRNALQKLHSLLCSPEITAGRNDLLREILLGYYRRDSSFKTVIFCASSMTARALGDYLSEHLPAEMVALVERSSNAEAIEAEVQRFREELSCCVLVSDALLEEGRNLQFASNIILYDLPFSPMRIEQRIGRLDRLDRIEPIPVKAILSVDDEDLALDTAWYKWLVEGFGLFDAPLSDLQLLIDEELPGIAERLFRGGPSAIASPSHIGDLREKVKRERERIAEQDIVDGLRLDTQQAIETWTEVQDAERLSGQLTSSMAAYLRDSLRFNVRFLRDGPGLSYSMCERQEPLIPIDRLLFLAPYSNREFTASRPKASQHEEPELLRIGHPIVEGVRRLLMWDDRGRAFAFWRQVPTINEPLLLFRAWVVASVDASSLKQRVDPMAQDALSRASFERLLGTWFPPRMLEFTFDAYGRPVTADYAAVLAPAYNNKVDINLGGPRAHSLVDTFGVNEWPATCELVGVAAVEAAKQDHTVSAAITSARAAAAEHFRLIRLRMTARSRAGADTEAQSVAVSAEVEDLRTAVDTCMASPDFRIDTFGAYVLSGEPICER